MRHAANRGMTASLAILTVLEGVKGHGLGFAAPTPDKPGPEGEILSDPPLYRFTKKVRKLTRP